MKNLITFCITNVPNLNLENLDLTLVGVGKNKFSEKYIDCINGNNIQFKEKYYSELTFHYWLWKNKLDNLEDDKWYGFCQKRRFWLKENSPEINNFDELNLNILREIPIEWEKYDAFVCNPIPVSPAKKIKILKRGFRNWILNPTIFFDTKKHNIKLQFDMFHGHGILEKSISVMKKKYQKPFLNFINNNTEFNPHIMFISKKKIIKHWCEDLFEWLLNCETLFGFKNLIGYDKNRLYAYLAERYLSFWFQYNYNVKNCSWTFFDTTIN
jgi:hypothetical protein